MLRRDGEFFALEFRNSIAHRVAAEIQPDGSIGVRKREQADLASFTNLFMKNVQEQQRIDLR